MLSIIIPPFVLNAKRLGQSMISMAILLNAIIVGIAIWRYIIVYFGFLSVSTTTMIYEIKTIV